MSVSWEKYIHKDTYNYYLNQKGLDDLDRFSEVKLHGTTLEDEVKKFAFKNIVLKAIKITKHTDTMYDIMSEAYMSAVNNEMEVFQLDKALDKLEFFVSQGAIETINASFVNVDFGKLLEDIKNCTISSSIYSRSINMYSPSNEVYNVIKELDEAYNSAAIKSSDKQGETTRLETPVKKRSQPADWKKLGQTHEAVCYSFYIPKAFNRNINWKTIRTNKEQLKTTVMIDKEPFSKGAMRYSFFLYDFSSEQKLVAKVPFDVSKSKYSLDQLRNDNMSLVVSYHISDEFNKRLIDIKQNEKLLNFVEAHVYYINDINLKYYQVENFIEGKYSF